MGKLFGTDGVRGVANEMLTAELAFNIGRAGAYVLCRHKMGKTKIIVGKDSRISGDMLEAALSAGICSVGGEVVSLGIIPTPAVAYLTAKYNADAGVMISASHNPMEYNGIKFFNHNGYKLSDEIENEIEEHIFNNCSDIEKMTHGDIGRITKCDTAAKDYVEFAISRSDCRFDGKKVVLDCANGASYITSPSLFKSLGAEVITINDAPSGTNINKNCGSTHIEALQNAVKEHKADVGFAYDGDADRCLAVDENGNLTDGDKMMLICAKQLKDEGKLKNNTLVVTIMSNLGLILAAEENGINTVQTQVGDRYVLENMLENGYSIGGEQSGHIILLDKNTTGDGLLSSIAILSVMIKTGKKLSELAKVMNVLPQALVNARVSEEYKEKYESIPQIMQETENLKAKLSGKGRVLIRPSGTEPLVRVMIEGENLNEITKDAKALANLIEKLCN